MLSLSLMNIATDARNSICGHWQELQKGQEMRSQHSLGTVPLTPGATYAHLLCSTLNKVVIAALGSILIFRRHVLFGVKAGPLDCLLWSHD